jgi:glycosyltransferase involved in cell wall biosynthesis
VTAPYRLAVLASHVIQYQAPLFRALAADPAIDLTVFFCSRAGLDTYWDEGFETPLAWDTALLGGYRAEFLRNWSPRPHQARFSGLINPTIIGRLGAGRFDALLVHGWMRATNWLAIGAALGHRIPILMRGESNALAPARGWRPVVKRPLLSALFRRIDAFLAIGRHNADFYRRYGVPEEKIVPAPYSVDNDVFVAEARQLASAKTELKQAHGISSGLPVVLFVGKLIDVKRPADLLQAVEAVARSRQVALAFVGDGPRASSLARDVHDRRIPNVHFFGFRNQRELPSFYAMADLFVLPSSFEPWGLVVNEAMCFGLPVIVTDRVGAGGDLVRDDENGSVVSVGDTSALAARIDRVLGDEARRAAMGRKSLEIIEVWSQRETVRGVVTALARVTRRAAPAPVGTRA